MQANPGERLGPYELVAPIGAGGMGEVWRAHDSRLQRDVAIKLLPSADPAAVARFRREAQAASALSHPNILTIFDVGDGYIAMELVSGETLRSFIARGPRPEQTLDLLIQIAEGLAKAHDANIIHRDLKPDNIMVTSDGYAKILDFGLAKLLRDFGDDDATEVEISKPGMVAGTLAYMSPEQLRGEEVDARSDIYSFGCTAYETLTGKRLFTSGGEARVPARLQRIVSRCLEKDPAARYPSMHEVITDLRRIADRGGRRAMPRLTQLTFSRAIEHFPALCPRGERLAYSHEVGNVRKIFLDDAQLTFGDFDDIQPAWTSDGEALLFVRSREAGKHLEPADVFGRYDNGDIWRIDPASGKESILIDNGFNPACSPDGKWIAFDASWSGPRRIWLADSRGRNPQQLTTDATDTVRHVRPRWSPDGRRIVFQNIEGTKLDVRVVDVESKKMRWVTNDHVMDLHPVWSFDGDAIFLSSYRSGGVNIWRIPVDAEGNPIGAMEQITAGAGQDVDLDTPRRRDRLVFAILNQNADIWRLPVDPQSGEPAGAPEQVVAATRENSRGAWSPDGASIAFNSDRSGEMNLWLLTLGDNRVRQLTRGPGGDFQPNWSPDGQSLAFFSGRGGATDIWRYDFAGEALTRLTESEGIDINPCFSPDGARIAFQSDRDGHLEVWVMNADGSGVRQVTTTGVIGHFLRWTDDGAKIVFRCPDRGTPRTMIVAAEGGDPEPLADVAGGAHMSFSPDRTQIIDVVGHRALWVSPLAGGAPKKVFEFDDPDSRIDYPMWSPDGRWVLFDRFAPRGGDVWMVENLE